jgi:hypothetical protein
MNINNNYLKLFVTLYVYIDMKHKITKEQILKMHRKAMRETTVMPKPMVTTDKKKKADKNSCKDFKNKRNLFK